MSGATAKLAFVLEQTLGHVAHARNIERVLATRREIDPTLIELGFDCAGSLRRIPGLGSWSLRASWTARTALRRRLSSGGLDGVFIHTQVAALLSVGLMRRVPTVISLDATPLNYDSVAEAYGHRRQAEPVERVKLAVNRRALLAARALVTWCQWAKDSLVADYRISADRVMVIHPGVDQSLFRPLSRRRPGPPRVLFVGGDFRRKGGADLMAALAGIDSPYELEVVTNAPQPELTGRPGVRVHAGLRPQSPELVELYRHAHVFCLPSRGDCFPQAVAEAMACGLPVVATDVGAVPGLVTSGVTGYLVPPRSPADLRRALIPLLADPDLRQRMGREGQAIAVRDHDARRNCDAIFDLMHGLTARAAAA